MKLKISPENLLAFRQTNAIETYETLIGTKEVEITDENGTYIEVQPDCLTQYVVQLPSGLMLGNTAEDEDGMRVIMLPLSQEDIDILVSAGGEIINDEAANQEEVPPEVIE